MLASGRLCEFIDKVLKLHHDELKEKDIWDMWLHKEFEGNPGYSEFRAGFDTPETTAKPESSDLEAIVKDSQDILNSFNL